MAPPRHTEIEWKAGSQPDLLTLRPGLIFSLNYFIFSLKYVLFSSLLNECLLNHTMFKAQCWQVNGKSTKSQNLLWFLPLWLRRRLVKEACIELIVTEANGQLGYNKC